MRLMHVDWSRLPGIQVFTANHYSDERGFLLQSWVKSDLEAKRIPTAFGQAIQTWSRRGAVRGLHFQWDPPMGKLVRCISGAILDVVVDVRHGSPASGDHTTVELSARNHRIIWVPPGYAHGTFALEDGSVVLYECTTEHGPGREGGILWNDPALGITWPDIPPIVSEKDQRAPTLAEWLADPRSQNFRYHP
jgi:dTDP-4-dehydrorhamnose 3,5-epimerase